MFGSSVSLSSLNASNFNSVKVENMEGLFYYDINLISIDFSNFQTKNVKK